VPGSDVDRLGEIGAFEEVVTAERLGATADGATRYLRPAIS
jgi:hypothetical protein